MSLADYLIHAKKEHVPILTRQWKEATELAQVTCPCGQLRGLVMAYRCLYCGIWFCFTCAEIHFEQTFQNWIIEKRVESRKEKRDTLTAQQASKEAKHEP